MTMDVRGRELENGARPLRLLRVHGAFAKLGDQIRDHVAGLRGWQLSIMF